MLKKTKCTSASISKAKDLMHSGTGMATAKATQHTQRLAALMVLDVITWTLFTKLFFLGQIYPQNFDFIHKILSFIRSTIFSTFRFYSQNFDLKLEMKNFSFL